ncbi:MAG TPA: hypothetical protein DCM49_02085 [Lachnospiraceae bacterium]|nr:hypothetical protein [Lachnospiraceae bacterium]
MLTSVNSFLTKRLPNELLYSIFSFLSFNKERFYGFHSCIVFIVLFRIVILFKMSIFSEILIFDIYL